MNPAGPRRPGDWRGCHRIGGAVRVAAGVRSDDGSEMDRVERRHHQHALSAGSGRGANRRADAEARAEVGVRLSQRRDGARAADRGRRTPVRRQPERHGLRARRENRLHHLDVSRRRRGVRTGIVDRAASRGPGQVPGYCSAMCGANAYGVDATTGEQLWTRHARGSPHRQHHRHARRCIRIGCTSRSRRAKRAGHEPGVRMLHLPRQPRRARRRDRIARVEDLHDCRRSEADRQEPERLDAVGSLGRRRLVVADDRRQATCRLRGHRQHVHRSRSRRRATRSWRSISTAVPSNGSSQVTAEGRLHDLPGGRGQLPGGWRAGARSRLRQRADSRSRAATARTSLSPARNRASAGRSIPTSRARSCGSTRPVKAARSADWNSGRPSIARTRILRCLTRSASSSRAAFTRSS